MEALLEDVQASLDPTAVPPPTFSEDVAMHTLPGDRGTTVWDNTDGDFESHNQDFDDRGEGAGVEGDLDVDDD